VLFVLGANGSGKSSLMSHFVRTCGGTTRWISAHRQTWMHTDTLDMTPAGKVQTEQQVRSQDQQSQSRYRDDYAAQRAAMTIFEIIDAENVRARRIADLVTGNELDAAVKEAQREAPVAVINDLLRQSALPITIAIRENERVVASKSGGPEYSAAELSDGERNALMIAGNVLTAAPGTILIIDEPERHLHRSIVSPLLAELFRRRPDCAFVISTHDHGLSMEVPGARTLLLRSCTFEGGTATSWEADELPLETPLDDGLRRDLLGARRKILFVEGTETSLDKPLYALLFPTVSVIPKGGCRGVEQAVAGVRAGESLHWLRAFGVVDGDGWGAEAVEANARKGVHTLPYYSIESIYFHPKIVASIADQMGAEGEVQAEAALRAGVEAVSEHTERLSRRVVERRVRREMVAQIPSGEALLEGTTLVIANDARALLGRRKRELDEAVSSGAWERIIEMCSVRESPALDAIARALGFGGAKDYERAVLKLLMDDASLLETVRAVFGVLYEQLTSDGF